MFGVLKKNLKWVKDRKNIHIRTYQVYIRIPKNQSRPISDIKIIYLVISSKSVPSDTIRKKYQGFTPSIWNSRRYNSDLHRLKQYIRSQLNKVPKHLCEKSHSSSISSSLTPYTQEVMTQANSSPHKNTLHKYANLKFRFWQQMLNWKEHFSLLQH